VTAVFDEAQRAPRAEELYAFGPHVATGTFEIGDEDLDKEESIGGNIGLHFHNGKIDASVSFYRTEYDNFIYLEGSDLELDGLPVAYWSQADATFTGWEAQLSWDFLENRSGLWTFNALVDSVNASTNGGDNLPRIVPSRLGADIAWQLGNWTAGFGLMHVYDQDETAPGETETDGYNMVNANIAYRWTAGGTDLQVFLEGSNLADEEARVSTSYLKDFAPLPGRALQAGIRIFF
jgi:iron complex outermembrane receptor protein